MLFGQCPNELLYFFVGASLMYIFIALNFTILHYIALLASAPGLCLARRLFTSFIQEFKLKYIRCQVADVLRVQDGGSIIKKTSHRGEPGRDLQGVIIYF